MKNVEKSFPRVVAERTLSGLLMVGLAGTVVKAVDCNSERNHIKQLEPLDREEALLKERAEKKAQELQQTSPEAKEIINKCKTELSICMDRVGVPRDKACQNLLIDPKTFHEVIAKPREAHFFLNSVPGVYACDITIQSEINRCHEKMADCLESKK